MIIVTGAAGFIASNLLCDFNETGYTDLLLIDDLCDGNKWKNIAKLKFFDLIDYNQDILSELSKYSNIEIVYHLGANSSTLASDAKSVFETNFKSSKFWWEWCTENNVPLVYASSAATYGDGSAGFSDTLTLHEMDRLKPLNLYGWTKHQFDKWALERSDQGYCPPSWCGLKFFNVFGPNEYHKGEMRSVMAKNYHLVCENQPIGLFKSYRAEYKHGEQCRDFIYVKDCSRITRWLGERNGVNGLFNVGTGNARTFLDVGNGISAAAGVEASIEFIDMPEVLKEKYQYHTQADMKKLQEAGYNGPYTPLESALDDYVQNYLAMRDAYR